MSARDVVAIAVLIFVIGIGMFTFKFVGDTLVDNLIVAPVINQSSSTISAFQGIDTVTARFDYMVFALFIGLALGLLITGWLVGGHPMFMIMYMFLVVVGVAISTVLANAWETFANHTSFGTTITSFPITNHILLQLPLYICIIGFLGIVVMFGKPYITGEA